MLYQRECFEICTVFIMAMIDDTFMVGKISVKDHSFVEHFKMALKIEFVPKQKA